VAGAVITFSALSSIVVTVIGAVWAATYAVGLASWADGELRRAALLQEMFEVKYFDLPWNSALVGEPVRVEDVNRLSKNYKSKRQPASDWYGKPDSAEFPYPHDALWKQEENLSWGGRIRHRYANTILGVVTVWTVGGGALGAAVGLTIGQIILRWFVPSLGGLLLGLDSFRQQRGVVSERERVCRLAQNIHSLSDPRFYKASNGRVADAATVTQLTVLARQLQDILFLTRCRAPRVPSRLFYLRYYQEDRKDYEAAKEERAELIRRAATA